VAKGENVNPSKRTNYSEIFADFRGMINSIPSATERTMRQCPECGHRLTMVHGRRSGLFWYTHLSASDCIFDDWRERLRFNSAEKAEAAGGIFKNQATKT